MIFIPNLAEEVDVVLAHEKCGSDQVNRHIALMLIKTQSQSEIFRSHSELQVAHLIVESTEAIKVVKICSVGFAMPKI
jgi:hypothetical protein